jgi:hypothetical protein
VRDPSLPETLAKDCILLEDSADLIKYFEFGKDVVVFTYDSSMIDEF